MGRAAVVLAAGPDGESRGAAGRGAAGVGRRGSLDSAAAFKFALRSLSGVLAFFAARSLAERRGVAHAALLALLTGALLSAATALADGFVPGSAPAWRLFHAGTFDALGLKRASGVFEYPTIGAMYWEAAVPLLIAAPFVRRARADTGRRAVLLVAAASALLFLAIFASATRTALAGSAVACALMALLGRRSSALVPRAAAGALVVLAVLSVLALRPGGADSPLGQRLRWWHEQRWFGAEYQLSKEPKTVDPEEVFVVPITLRNTGAIAWRAGGARPTHLAYHWVLGPAGGAPTRFVEFDGHRTELPADVPPGGVVQVAGVVQAPTAPGAYRLVWDLVEEQVTWFSEQGNPMGEQAVHVRGALSPAPAELVLPRQAPPPASRPSLWRAAVALWRERPLLGVGPDNFRRRYESLLSPSPTGAPYTDTRIHANSLYFETLSDLGLAGLLALASIAAALLRSLRNHWETGCVAGLGCAVAAVAFFVHGLLDYFFEFTPLYGLFW